MNQPNRENWFTNITILVYTSNKECIERKEVGS